jgi:hypothetical protein
MAGRLNGRVTRLEDGREEPCEGCGWDGDWSNTEIVVTWGNVDPDTDPDDSRPEWCGTCGHQLTYVVTWADLPDPKGAV